MQLSRSQKTLIGMVHLAALPGSPQFGGDLNAVIAKAVADAKAIAAGGFHAVLIENFGDAPFYPDQVPQITIAAMTRVAIAIQEATTLALGINVLRNDVISALAIAKATESSFVRVNILAGARLTDQGIVSGKAFEVLRLRDAWQSTARIFADVDVKHSAPLAPYDLVQEAKDLVHRAGADALIVSGSGTGQGIDVGELKTVRDAISHPILLGSGVTAGNVCELLALADGAIIGSSLKSDLAAPIDVERVRAVQSAVNSSKVKA